MQSGLTIRELSDLTGMTVRNIRAHQSRGLLGPPRIHGRIAYYDAHHVARLELVSSLQQEGFTLGAIKHLLESTGSYAAVVAERRRGMREGDVDIRSEVPLTSELAVMRGIDSDLPERLVSLGLLRRDGEEWLIPTPIAGIARVLTDRGVPREGMAEVAVDVAEYAQRVAGRLTRRLSLDSQEQPATASVAVQLVCAMFEAALARAVSGDPRTGDVLHASVAEQADREADARTDRRRSASG
jgi:DNA-binding transcriptional MerR regulator